MPRRVLLPFVLALLATLAVFAAITWFDRDPDSSPSTTFTHQFDPDDAGPFWITVTSEAAGPQALTLRWGPWEQTTEHAGTTPVTYVFAEPQPDPSEPLVVEVPEGGEVEFGQGPGAPSPSVPLDEAWAPAEAGAP